MTAADLARVAAEYRTWMQQRGRRVVEWGEVDYRENIPKRIKLPHGRVLYSTWYEDAVRLPSGKLRSYESYMAQMKSRRREQNWLLDNQPSAKGLDQ